MGPVLAICVAVAIVAMLTLLPALLVICGRWVFWPARPAYGAEEPSTRGLWARAGELIGRRPRVVWLATVVVLGAMALGLTGLKAGGLTQARTFRGHPDSVTGQAVIDQNFTAGGGEPVQVVANAACTRWWTGSAPPPAPPRGGRPGRRGPRRPAWTCSGPTPTTGK